MKMHTQLCSSVHTAVAVRNYRWLSTTADCRASVNERTTAAQTETTVRHQSAVTATLLKLMQWASRQRATVMASWKGSRSVFFRVLH